MRGRVLTRFTKIVKPPLKDKKIYDTSLLTTKSQCIQKINDSTKKIRMLQKNPNYYRKPAARQYCTWWWFQNHQVPFNEKAV